MQTFPNYGDSTKERMMQEHEIEAHIESCQKDLDRYRVLLRLSALGDFESFVKMYTQEHALDLVSKRSNADPQQLHELNRALDAIAFFSAFVSDLEAKGIQAEQSQKESYKLLGEP